MRASVKTVRDKAFKGEGKDNEKDLTVPSGQILLQTVKVLVGTVKDDAKICRDGSGRCS